MQSEKVRYSARVLLYRQHELSQMDEHSIQKMLELNRINQIKYFFRNEHIYRADQRKHELLKVLYVQMFRPNFISIKLNQNDCNKHLSKYANRPNIVKDNFNTTVIDKQEELSKAHQRYQRQHAR